MEMPWTQPALVAAQLCLAVGGSRVTECADFDCFETARSYEAPDALSVRRSESFWLISFFRKIFPYQSYRALLRKTILIPNNHISIFSIGIIASTF